jgi:FkbM family methyltransferase
MIAVMRRLPPILRYSLLLVALGIPKESFLFKQLHRSENARKHVDELMFLKEHLELESGCIFVDVGAYLGVYTTLASRKVGERGLVVATEPHPKSFSFLCFIVRLLRLKNVRPVGIAIYSKDTETDLYIGREPGLSSVMPGYDYGLGRVKIKALTLDSLLDKMSIDHVDVLKITAEGAELEVLRGMTRSIKTCGLLLVEMHGKPYMRKLKSEQIEHLLHQERFSIKKQRKYIVATKM